MVILLDMLEAFTWQLASVIAVGLLTDTVSVIPAQTKGKNRTFYWTSEADFSTFVRHYCILAVFYK